MKRKGIVNLKEDKNIKSANIKILIDEDKDLLTYNNISYKLNTNIIG